jgi:hypothetical protein
METTKFKDAENDEWILSISIADARRMKKELDVDLDKTADGEIFLELARSRMKLGGALWILCEKQCERRNLNPDEFAERLCTECLDDAALALAGAIVNFTPTHLREAVKTVMEQALESTATGTQAMKSWVTANKTKLDREIQTMVSQELDRELSGKSLTT